MALVTGAAGGIGRACAIELHDAGYAVLCVDIDGAGVAEVAGELERQRRGSALAFVADVGDGVAAAAITDAAIAAFGRVDALVHCAGITMGKSFLELSGADWSRVIGVNLDGTFHVCQAAARAMAARRAGAIVTLSSVTGQRATSGRAAYAASKGGVIALTRAMAVELAEHGVRVNCIAPGAVETGLSARQHTGSAAFIRTAYEMQTPLRRYGAPREIARAALFLCSDAASYITGHVLDVDGGFMAAGMLAPKAAS